MNITKIKSWQIRPDYSGIDLFAVGEDGKDTTISLPLHLLLGVMEACSAGAVSICKKTTGQFPSLPAIGVQVAASNKASIALEFAFGKRGQVYFDVPREMCRALRDQISLQLQETAKSTPPQPPQH